MGLAKAVSWRQTVGQLGTSQETLIKLLVYILLSNEWNRFRIFFL